MGMNDFSGILQWLPRYSVCPFSSNFCNCSKTDLLKRVAEKYQILEETVNATPPSLLSLLTSSGKDMHQCVLKVQCPHFSSLVFPFISCLHLSLRNCTSFNASVSHYPAYSLSLVGVIRTKYKAVSPNWNWGALETGPFSLLKHYWSFN